MGLNWTLSGLTNVILTTTLVICLVVCIQAYRRGNRYRFFIMFASMLIIQVFHYLAWLLGSLFMLASFLALGVVLASIACLILLLMADTLLRDTVEPVKLSLYLILAAISVYVVYLPDSFVPVSLPDGTQTFQVSKLFAFLGTAEAFFPGLVLIYCLIRTIQSAPRNLRSDAGLFLLGYLLTFISTPMLEDVTIRVLSTLMGVGGTLLLTFIVARNPKVFFIYSIKALRLTVLDTKSGIPLFTYTWATAGDIVNEDMYAGMLQGVNLIIRDSLKQGDVQEIKMANAILLTYRDSRYPVACVLVAKKVTRALRDALKLFAEKFYTRFGDKFANVSDDAQFAPASGLITECFPFVPEYK